ncbi:MAG TPA: hypothetical protein VGO62_15455 [Myxococcota bacterium]
MTSAVVEQSPAAPTRSLGWLSGPLDGIIAFGFVPFYLWILTTPLVGDVKAHAYGDAFTAAFAFALAVNWVHRHFVYLLFFGDPQQRARHPRGFWFLPISIVVVVGSYFVWHRAFIAISWILAAWNIWHTLMQRHGIFRAYAARSGVLGGGRRDLALIWSLMAVTLFAVIAFDQWSFSGPAAVAWKQLGFISQHPELQLGLLFASVAVAAVVAAWWLRGELAEKPRTSRLPRLLFLASTLLLLTIVILHGPVVGFLVFSIAHAVEYIAFVHVYTGKRARSDDAPLSIQALGRVVPFVVVTAVLLVSFVALRPIWSWAAVTVYYLTTSALHYLYDGLIWKIRRPEVRAPIVAA